MPQRHMLSRLVICALITSITPTAWAQLPTCETSAQPTLGQAVSVADFGASPNASASVNQVAIQSALNSLTPGQVLTFPPGVYRHSARLAITKAGSVIDGSGATLVGSNIADQALMIQANDVEVRNLTIANATGGRQTTPWASAIAAYPGPYQNIRILNNRIIASGTWESDTQYQNSASAAGIFIYNVDGFIIYNNIVEKTLADAIHITRGSRNGKVTHNLVKSSGDDGIAVVSYQDKPSESNPNWLLNNEATSRVRNVLIESNSVSHVYWGRGITVVGGRDVTIRKNHVHDIFGGSSILLAREGNRTLGVKNVIVDRNLLTDNQTTYPNLPVFYPRNNPWFTTKFFNSDGSLKNPESGQQASIDLIGSFAQSEKNHLGWQDALTINTIKISRNVIERPKWAGINLGKDEYTAEMHDVNLKGNLVDNSKTGRSYSVVAAGFSALPHCADNKYGDAVVSIQSCAGTSTVSAVTGFNCQ